MHIYTPIRRVKKIIGTTSGGNPLWGGPYEYKRDLPIAALAAAIGVALCAAGFAAARLAGAVVGVVAAAVVLGGALYLIGRFRRSPEGFNVAHWIGSHIDMHFARSSLIDGPNPFHPANAPTGAHRGLSTIDVIDDNIRVTATGQYWAEYRIGNPLEMGLVDDSQHNGVLAEHQALLSKLLRHGAYIAQVKEPIGRNELFDRAFTRTDADAEQLPLYSLIVCDQIDALHAETADKGPGHWPHRINHILAIYVGDNAATAARRRDEIIADLPFSWQLTPASASQMYWTWYAQCTSGVQMVSTRSPALPETLPTITVEDGAHSDSMFGQRRKFFRRRELLPVVKITVDDAAPSYQSVLTVKLPDALDFPGETDFLSVLCHMGEPINWAIRCTPKTREHALEDNRKNQGTIDDNTDEIAPFWQQGGDPYDRENELLAIYNNQLKDPAAAAVTFTLFISIAAASAAEVKRIANAVRDVLSRMGIIPDPPQPGAQEELWSALQPGAPRSPAMEHHAAETTVSEFAELVPFTTASIGHADGPVIGRNLTSGLGELVRFAAEKLILAGRAATLAIVASVGGGKSTLGKMLAIFAHLRGDPWGAFDRSDITDDKHPHGIGEWAKLGEVLDDVQIIDITSPPGSLDPLKVWADEPQTACRYTYNVLIDLLEGLDDTQKLALAEALDPSELHARGLTSLMALARYLLASQSDPAAVMVGRKIRVWRHRPFAAALFDEQLPALTLTARGTVFRTHGLSLPTMDKVLNKHLYDKLTPEERYAPAIYTLGSVFLKSAFRASKLRRGERGPAYIFVDEAWTITRNPIGMEILEVDVRDGRKHFLVVVFMTHHAAQDLAHDAFQLVTTKFIGRAEDKALARSNLAWFDAMPITDERIADLMAAKDGRFYMSMINDDADNDQGSPVRDEKQRRQVAEIQIMRPSDPRILEALNTTPQMGARKARSIGEAA
ncbi:hypothetical protein C0J29_31755 (plasmid) [Mycobacterium paragordonae]|uniref:ATP-binding protein n=1 Tax=Mycobacterium paragordonae TaxID=1389713 RepID=A0ABQ1CG56_9MYCO|nr:ATP-binding protein [Mycobacterium paragordonae]AYE99542.1 hypothetical protein C0J29_31755 [Mycobacterium paragordonae]GFG83244.1 hypothetical protein MPRG_65200 [Mycobacterium paragordonae]